MVAETTLAEYRRLIDETDAQLVALLNRRAELVIAVAHVKQASGLPIHIPARELEVLTRVTAHNAGPLEDAAIRRLFEHIIAESRRLEQAVLGISEDAPAA
ncbi:MAG: chorismate mutase [Chloracidobacterium sp.]|nr:chorismate mutase [Chloracidobacterium sp.]MDW8217436.1 chorismate mutase [Acidobacteriota bacterium]